MSLTLSALVAAVTRTRSTDNGERSVNAMSRRVAPMIAVSLLGIGGYRYVPLPDTPEAKERKALQQAFELQQAKTAELNVTVALAVQELRALGAKVEDVSAKRTAQVERLEARILTCELHQAAQGKRK